MTPRRLLLVLAGLGGGAIAAVLWSGSAYAATTPERSVPHVVAPAPTSGSPLSLPKPVAPPLPRPPATPPRAKPSLPAPTLPVPVPVPVPPVVEHALTIVPPLVDHTVRTVREIVPVDLPLVSTPASPASTPRAHSAARPAQALVAAPASHHRSGAFAPSARTGSPASMHVPAPRDRAAAPAVPASRVPLGDLADGTNHAPQTANGTPFAVTGVQLPLADASWHGCVLENARVPAAVSLRDIARPG